MCDGPELRSERQLRYVGKIVEVKPSFSCNGVVLRRFQHVAVGVELLTTKVVDHQVGDLAIVCNEFGLEQLGDFSGVAILVSLASLGRTKRTGGLTIGDEHWLHAPVMGGGDDQIGSIDGIGGPRELNQHLALIYERGEGSCNQADTASGRGSGGDNVVRAVLLGARERARHSRSRGRTRRRSRGRTRRTSRRTSRW